MLAALETAGFELTRYDVERERPAVPPRLTDNQVSSIAERWLATEQGHVEPGVQADRAESESVRQFVTEAFPEVAAALGYAIVRRGMPAFPEGTGDDPAQWWVFTRRPSEVTAERQAESWEWSTTAGDVLMGSAGDWLVTDERGDQRSVAADKFNGLYAPSPGTAGRFHRIGHVRARPARIGEVVESLEGATTAVAGDWLVQGDQGERWLVPGSAFAAGYLSNGPHPEAAE
ncbi:hypothetical protein ACFQNE_11590 [Gordonia phosphorivorans]|uniref:Uncharacterized protein n=1 Tax=Gordonia phosphorivorans TaxID=1056982 RepID=A0ABV6HD17_9ACTN